MARRRSRRRYNLSAGGPAPKVQRDLTLLAPKFQTAVRDAIAECSAAGLDAIVFETLRSAELQAEYYTRGRTKKPPERPVTNAKSSLYSWHGFGLAVDVISKEHGWSPKDGWWEKVAAIFKRHGCKWGGDWRQVDLPHFQWELCKPSPSDEARSILKDRGLEAVWRAVGAA